MNNPFSITFGKYPSDIIQRHEIFDEIITSFDNRETGTPVFILVGARGCGKTVTMTSIANHFKDENKYLVVDLNPHLDLLEQLAASLYNKGKLKHLFLKSEFSFSFKGFSFSICGERPVTNIQSLLDLILTYLKKKGVSVVVTIDEANNNKHMQVFSHAFQSFLREGYYINLLMTGLHENISNLENEKSLTFLYRAPKIYLPPLNIRAIAYSYEDLLSLDEETALAAANLTKGYAFAYQLLGYIMFEKNKKVTDKEVIRAFDLALDEKSYSKIFSELTEKEKEIVFAISDGNTTNEEIMNQTNLKQNSLSAHKNNLYKKGILDISQRGINAFALPRFDEFLKFQQKL